MKNNRTQFWKSSVCLGLVLLMSWMLQGGQAIAQSAVTITKPSHTPRAKAAPLSAAAAEVAGLDGLSFELSQTPAAMEPAGMALDQLHFELAQIAPRMHFDADCELALPGLSVAPMALAQTEAAIGSLNYGLSGLAPAIAEGSLFWQDVAAVAGQESGAAAKSYQRAYDFVLDKKWVEAQKELDNFISKYRNSSYVDAARYWRCYTQEKSGSSHEEAFKKYQEFVKSYPHSRWADDARTNMIRIGSELARQGKSEYATIAQSLQQGDDDDVKLTALYALRSNAD